MKNHLVLEKSWIIAIGTISEPLDDSRENAYMDKLETIKIVDGIPTCVIKWKYPRLLIGVMRLGLFVIYVTKTIHLRLLLVVGVVKFAIQRNTACEIRQGKIIHILGSYEAKRRGRCFVIQCDILMLYNSRV